MSKSLGNGIDPLEVIKLYGADSMRFTLAYQAAQGQDILIDMESFKFGSKFVNKLWNAARFIFMNLEGTSFIELKDLLLDDFDKWILTKMNECTQNVRQAFSMYKINDAAQALYDFFWSDFCDWYIEFTKANLLTGDMRLKSKTVSLLLYILENVVGLISTSLI